MVDLFNCKAYHKAGYENAIKSIRWQAFYTGSGDRLWLGDGVYFWERFEDAEWWDGKYVSPVILIVDLICEKSLFLDLDDEQVKNEFYSYIKQAFAVLAEKGIDIHISNSELVTGASCNYFKRKFKTKLIRYSFPLKSNRPQFCATSSDVAINIQLANSNVTQYLKENPYEYI